MEETFEVLRKLQQILSDKYIIERDILDIPKALNTKQEILNRLKKSFIQKNEQLGIAKNEIMTLTFEMNEAERRREKSEKQMDFITTQREYEALDKEIRDATEKEQRLRREIQKREEDLKEMHVTLEREEQMIDTQEKDLKAENERIEGETRVKKSQLEELAKQENEVAPHMNEDILFKFKRIIKNKSGIGIVPTKANVCSGCHMLLPAQFVNDVRNGEDIQFCPYCSRILFWEEGGDSSASIYEFTDEDVGGLSDLLDHDDDDEL